jgi:hypothetical protein
MKTPRKHAELIKAWADGSEIEVQLPSGAWCVCHDPYWGENSVYRIKPEPKPDVVYYGVFDRSKSGAFLDAAFTKFNDYGDHIKITFDGETGKLIKAEVL